MKKFLVLCLVAFITILSVSCSNPTTAAVAFFVVTGARGKILAQKTKKVYNGLNFEKRLLL